MYGQRDICSLSGLRRSGYFRPKLVYRAGGDGHGILLMAQYEDFLKNAQFDPFYTRRHYSDHVRLEVGRKNSSAVFARIQGFLCGKETQSEVLILCRVWLLQGE
jgi:hypothetical protein